MTEDVHKKEDESVEVVEKRLKPTLIRRRARAVSPSEEKKPEEIEILSAQPKASEVTPPSPAATQKSEPTPGAPGEKRVGLVGHIDDFVTPKPVKEEKVVKEKPVTRRKRTREEIEAEDIERVGGLRHFAEIVRSELDEPSVDVPPSVDVVVPAVEERVFRPKATGRRKKTTKKEEKKTQITQPKAIKRVIRIQKGMTVSALSQAIGVKTGDIIKKLMDLGVMATANQTIDHTAASTIAETYEFTIQDVGFKEETLLTTEEETVEAKNLTWRPPVVTVMGHVDHGKTSLLDAIRKTNVTASEAGGITQHIGAYQVVHGEKKVTFIDTPGHEAFTQLRARGAKVTDIVILVVAADDGVMPQTIEAINHAKAAEVPIIVAINKIDTPGAKADRVKQALTEHGLVSEEWGGDVICVETSAKTKHGIDKLLEMISLQAEVMELKADATIRPKGSVVEARLDKGRGPVASVLIHEGTLKKGMYVVCGLHWGRVRMLIGGDGKELKSATPSTPVEIVGLSGVPDAGDTIVGVTDEQGARKIAETRQQHLREQELAPSARTSLEDLQAKLDAVDRQELKVIIKGDVHGSVEAVAEALPKLSTSKVFVTVLHRAVGGITENDVMLAKASSAVIVGFAVRPDTKAREIAEREHVEIRTYRIIYEMVDDIKKAMTGLLAPVREEKVVGHANVRQVFAVSKAGNIAGCMVVSGKIPRGAKVRLLRDQVIVFEGAISSLKRFKDDAREVAEGFECGIGIQNFNDVKVGDTIEAYIVEEKAASLES